VQDLQTELFVLRAQIQVKRIQQINQRDRLAAELAGARVELAALSDG
jgi:hypothetical protein